MKKHAKKLIIVVSISVILWATISIVLSYKLTHREKDRYVEKVASKNILNILKPINLVTSDSLNISGVSFLENNNNTYVLILHGNGSDFASSYDLIDSLHQHHINSVAISLRSHGSSDGEINDIGYSAKNDVIEAINFIREKSKNAKIIIAGRSMGAAAAIFASKEVDQFIHGYIFESPYSDLQTAVKNRLKIYLPNLISDIAYFSLTVFSKIYINYLDDISPSKYLKYIDNNKQILFLAGSQDYRAPLNDIKKMSILIPGSMLEIFENANHQSLFYYNRSKYLKCLLSICSAE